MKHPKLKIKKKIKITNIRKFKNEVKETVHYCLMDIEPYLVNDVMFLLKKKGIIYAKTSKKNKKKTKKKR